jgi:hypothetical protein
LKAFKHVRRESKAFVIIENVSILTREDNMKIFQRYLCELCTNSIARRRGQDEFEFVVCAVGASGFPTDKRCQQFQIEDAIVE